MILTSIHWSGTQAASDQPDLSLLAQDQINAFQVGRPTGSIETSSTNPVANLTPSEAQAGDTEINELRAFFSRSEPLEVGPLYSVTQFIVRENALQSGTQIKIDAPRFSAHRLQANDPNGANYVGIRLPAEALFEIERYGQTASLILTINSELALDATFEIEYRSLLRSPSDISPLTLGLMVRRNSESPWLDIQTESRAVIGGPAKRLQLNAPTFVSPGEAFELEVIAVDQFGHPSPTQPRSLDLRREGRLVGQLSRDENQSSLTSQQTIERRSTTRFEARSPGGGLRGSSSWINVGTKPETLLWTDFSAASLERLPLIEPNRFNRFENDDALGLGQRQFLLKSLISDELFETHSVGPGGIPEETKVAIELSTQTEPAITALFARNLDLNESMPSQQSFDQNNPEGNLSRLDGTAAGTFSTPRVDESMVPVIEDAERPTEGPAETEATDSVLIEQAKPPSWAQVSVGPETNARSQIAADRLLESTDELGSSLAADAARLSEADRGQALIQSKAREQGQGQTEAPEWTPQTDERFASSSPSLDPAPSAPGQRQAVYSRDDLSLNSANDNISLKQRDSGFLSGHRSISNTNFALSDETRHEKAKVALYRHWHGPQPDGEVAFLHLGSEDKAWRIARPESPTDRRWGRVRGAVIAQGMSAYPWLIDYFAQQGEPFSVLTDRVSATGEALADGPWTGVWVSSEESWLEAILEAKSFVSMGDRIPLALKVNGGTGRVEHEAERQLSLEITALQPVLWVDWYKNGEKLKRQFFPSETAFQSDGLSEQSGSNPTNQTNHRTLAVILESSSAPLAPGITMPRNAREWLGYIALDASGYQVTNMLPGDIKQPGKTLTSDDGMRIDFLARTHGAPHVLRFEVEPLERSQTEFDGGRSDPLSEEDNDRPLDDDSYTTGGPAPAFISLLLSGGVEEALFVDLNRVPALIPPANFQFPTLDLNLSSISREIDIEGYRDRVTITWVPRVDSAGEESLPKRQSILWTDRSPARPGDYYWSHVLMLDGTSLWSSPVFVGGQSLTSASIVTPTPP